MSVNLNKVYEWQLLFNKYWGKESAYVDGKCGFYQLKKNLIMELIKEDVISMNDLDDRNRTPHVRITDKKTYPFCQKAYDNMHGKMIKFTLKDINIHKEHIDIDLGYSGRVETHMTLIYKSNIIEHKDKILSILSKILENIIPPAIEQSLLPQIPKNEVPVMASVNGNIQCNQNGLCTNCIAMIARIKQCGCGKV